MGNRQKPGETPDRPGEYRSAARAVAKFLILGR